VKRSLPEQRKYIRLDSIFPVEIYISTSRDNKKPRLIQAFTRDVSFGGLSLTVNDPDPEFIAALASSSGTFDVNINIPVTQKPVRARARVAWREIIEEPRHKKLLIGVSYENITPADRNRIMNAARRIKWLPRAAISVIALLLIFLGVSYHNTTLLRNNNKALIGRFYKIQNINNIYETTVAKINKRHESLKDELLSKEKSIAELEKKIKHFETVPAEGTGLERDALQKSLAATIAEKKALEDELKAIRARKEKASALLRETRERRRELEEATVMNMYEWLKIHQNRFTGLVMSFEGDSSVKNWAFTYDQSLACQVFLISGDTERAGKVLSFFKNKAKKKNGAFYNAYNVRSGSPVEYVINAGPNVWIGIAALQYTRNTGDRAYLKMAENIAGWATALKDRDGGIKGGPKFSWYSTEHNLDAYALFAMLYEITGKNKYKKEKDVTLKWIRENTYSASGGRIKRGKGDATVATDTMAWAVAAVGPEKLLEQGMDPDAIMNFAEEHCVVSTKFRRPDGSTVRLTGFDFGKARNVARGGVVSSEWTAQMITAFNIMENFYLHLGDKEKARGYAKKAKFYLNELDKMVISSPSLSGQGAGCLPYASQPSADTGHGWRTPLGIHTGSVAGTAYTIFAKKDYNPLNFE